MVKRRVLNKKFFYNSPQDVALNLLGKVLVRKIGKKFLYLIITETEAYLSEKDLASHARFGKTERNAVMFENGGVWYVYLVYGMHWLLNVVTQKRLIPSAVLIRNGILVNQSKEIKGPGKITKALKINGSFWGKEISKKSNLWIEDWAINFKEIKKLPRIGVEYAGKWAKKPLRFSANIDSFVLLR